MNIWWPDFYDSEFKPTFNENLAIHWKANMLMLRSPKAIALFCIITLLPIGACTAISEVANPFVWDGATQELLTSILPLFTAFLFVFLIIQHICFVIAMNITYVPFVRDAIQAKGIPICKACGHLLGKQSELCGECGNQITASNSSSLQ